MYLLITNFELNGDKENINIHTISNDPTSLLYGALDAKFKIDERSAESFVNWEPNPNNTYSKPANFRLNFNQDNIKISDIYLDYKPVEGNAWLEPKTKKIGGSLKANGVEFGSILGLKEFSSNTDININISGYSLNIKTK